MLDLAICYNPSHSCPKMVFFGMKSSPELTQAVKDKAYRLGFHLAGITTPEPALHLDIYERWLAAGRHANMSWMGTARARQRRANPLLILPECETILVLGILYSPSPPTLLPVGEGQMGEGRIASYAWGEDYHDVLPERLQTLVTWLEGKAGRTIPNRWYTDTGPILERELAQRAGLGWIGKNTNLINPHIGSYFLLAEIFLGIDLVPDAPFVPDHCGSCTRCIEACPTDCILPDRTIDANRCISYLTIEEKGAISIDLRSQMENWVFGCDICQQVCPWNQRFAPPVGDPAFEPRSGVVRPSLRGELSLSAEVFNRKFKGSPIKRTKRRGYLRNVAVALGNAQDTTAVRELIHALSDDEPLVRGHAAWALSQIGGDEAFGILATAIEMETNDFVNAEIQKALMTLKSGTDKA